MNFGIASGVPEPVRYDQLVSKSLRFVLSSIGYYTDVDRDALQVAAKELFADVEKGVLRVRVNHKFPLSQASQAQMAIESRKTTGSIVLIPDEE